jgi:hypothetical protein
MIVDFANPEKNQYSLETGISENLLGGYHYFNLNENHFNFSMMPMIYDSLNTTQNHRFSTMKLLYKGWEKDIIQDQEETKV